jgi:hypothetical protein
MPAPGTAWSFRAPVAMARDQRRLLGAWLADEVVPFSAYWGQRLAGVDVTAPDVLSRVPVTEEADVAGAGGPGNPALLLLPSEDAFKRHAGRGELLAAAREVGREAGRGGGGVEARRAALFRRYKPVHVHEAGVAALLAVAYSRTDLDRLHLGGARLVEVLGLGADDALVNAVPAGPSVRFWGLYHAALAARMTALHPVTAGADPVAAVARALALLPATVLAAPAAQTLPLLGELAARGVRADRLRAVVTVGPPPPAALRAEIATAALELGANGVRVQAVWAPETARALWGECRPAAADPADAAYGLHTYPDFEIVEVRDVESGAGAEPRTPGELVYTSLGWRGTALVRLATGAWTGGLATGVPCPACGRTVPRLAPAAVDGAWQPRVETSDGRRARVDLRKAAPVLRRASLQRARVRDWSLRAVDGRLVLGLDVDGDDTRPAVELARAVGQAVGVVPDVVLGARAASARPQLGEAG